MSSLLIKAIIEQHRLIPAMCFIYLLSSVFIDLFGLTVLNLLLFFWWPLGWMSFSFTCLSSFLQQIQLLVFLYLYKNLFLQRLQMWTEGQWHTRTFLVIYPHGLRRFQVWDITVELHRLYYVNQSKKKKEKLLQNILILSVFFSCREIWLICHVERDLPWGMD